MGFSSRLPVVLLLLLLGIATLAGVARAQGEWISTGSLVAGRAGHTATTLLDGKVLVVGGSGGSGGRTCLNSAEVYDPFTERWTATQPMSVGRCFHTATLVDDGTGRVLVTGGLTSNGTVLASTEYYEPGNNSWTSNPRDNMLTPRAYHAAVLLSRGDVLVIGGFNPSQGILSTAEQYRVDTPLSPWNPVGGLKVPRANHTATRLPNDRIIVVGGTSLNGTDTATAELCSNLVYCTWVYTANDMGEARHSHTATLLSNGDLLIVGGVSNGAVIGSSELYDNSYFSGLAFGLVNPRFQHATSLLPDGNVLAAGGVDSSGGFLDTIELYTTSTRRWSRGGLGTQLGTARGSFTLSLLNNGLVLAAGGNTQRSAASITAELFDPNAKN